MLFNLAAVTIADAAGYANIFPTLSNRLATINIRSYCLILLYSFFNGISISIIEH